MASYPLLSAATQTGEVFHAVMVGGVPRMLARIPPRDDAWKDWFAPWGWSMGYRDDGDARPFECLDYDLMTVNQGQIGSCTNGATKGAAHKLRYKAGAAFVELSGTWAYAHCNGGRDQGASISDVVNYVAANGLCTEAACPQTTWNASQVRDATQATREASRFRYAEVYRCQSFRDALDAVSRGFEVVGAVMVGNRFNDVDRATWLCGLDRGPGNHAIHMSYGIRSINGKPALLCRNSWGDDWPWKGARGFFCVDQARFDCVSYQECVAIRYMPRDPQDADAVADA